MKKLLIPFVALAALLLATSCGKDSEGEKPAPQPASGEGVYSPAKKIASIYVDEQLDEQWTWVNNLLQHIKTPDEDGNMTISSEFEYDNASRFSYVSLQEDLVGATVTLVFEYSGSQLTSIELTAPGLDILSADITHGNGNKVTHADISINNAVLQLLAQLLMSGMMPTPDESPIVAVLTDVLTPQVLNTILRSVSTYTSDAKLTVDNAHFTIDFAWNGNNVNRTLIAGTVAGSVTGGELASILEALSNLGLAADLGAIGTLIGTLASDMVIPISLDIHDTVDLTYDSQHNPFTGFLGRLDPSVLSANNPLTSTNHGGVIATLTINLPIIGGDRSFPFQLPTSVSTFEYTYTSDGYPETVVTTTESTSTNTEDEEDDGPTTTRYQYQ